MSEARIHDQGYRRFEGERLGVSSAIVGLITHAIQRVLGLRRPLKSKILPGLVLAISFAPAIVFIGLAALLSGTDVAEEILPGYSDYYGFIVIGVLLFAAFVAPEVLCTDRTSGMLSLYLSSPLTRDTYVLAKAAAVVSVLLTVTVAPLLLLLVAYTLEGEGPGGVLDFIELFARIVAAGTAAALMPASVSLGISSLTSRRSFASAGIIVVLVAGSIVANVLTEPTGLDLDPIFGLFDLFGLPFELAVRILGERSTDGALSRLDDPAIVAGNVGWIVVFGLLTRFQYQRVAVDR